MAAHSACAGAERRCDDGRRVRAGLPVRASAAAVGRGAAAAVADQGAGHLCRAGTKLLSGHFHVPVLIVITLGFLGLGF